MISVKMTGDRELSVYLGGVSKGALGVANRIVGRGAPIVKRNIQLNLSGRVLKVRNNQLRSSIEIARGNNADGSPFAAVGTNVVYAAIHEFGGIIRPKRAKFLAIPFPGVKGSPRDYKNTFVHNGIIFQGWQSAKGNVGGIEPLFSLKRQVVIPKRPYMSTGLEMSIPEIKSIANEEMNGLMNK
jgi:phage gpG-like protein